ncbi:MAG: T9SS type A sorting domain-containing protein, partial [Bacteroidia bacterium]|nr:T9SS type A sorting domain-containing protein [Bacteroidia bacterium]
ITIPAGASIGQTRMRIRCLYRFDPWVPIYSNDYCFTSFVEGETHDYLVNIIAPPLRDAEIRTIRASCPGEQIPQFTIRNSGSTTITSISVNWTVNGVAQTPITITGLNILPGATSGLLNLSNVMLNAGASNTILVTITGVNGSTDLNPTNDSRTETINFGSTITWIGSASTAWDNSANWYPNCVPTCASDVLIPPSPASSFSGVTFNTTYDNQAHGIIFSITNVSTNIVRITDLWTGVIPNTGANGTIEVRWRRGGVVTYDDGNWTFAGSTTQAFNPTAIYRLNTTATITFGQYLGPGETITYYLTSINNNRYIAYLNTTSGTPISNGTIAVNRDGFGQNYLFAGGFPPRTPTLLVNYDVGVTVSNWPNVNITNAEARNLTISNSATLSESASGILSICGNFTNNGTFNTSASTTNETRIVGTTNQTIDGAAATAFTGTNRFNILRVNKISGSVSINRNVEINNGFSNMAGNAGTFNVGTFNFTINNGDLTNIDGTFNCNTGVVTIANDLISSGTGVFNANTNTNTVNVARDVLVSSGTVNLNSGTIDAARDVTISGTGVVNGNTGILRFGRDYTNNATFNCFTSNVIADGSSTQNLNGTLSGTGGQFYDLTILNNSTNFVEQNALATVTRHFRIQDGRYDCNGWGLNVGGNFRNDDEFIHGNNTVSFITGTSPAYYIKSASGIGNFHNVTMNKAGQVELTDPANMSDMILSPTGILNLNNGWIVTGPSRVVFIDNPSTGAVINGSVNSFVSGRLRRDINASGSYMFPIGYAPNTSSYRLINPNFTSAGDYTQLTAFYTPSIDAPITATTPGDHCGPPQDPYSNIGDGIWTITGSPVATNKGNYSIRAYPGVAFTVANALLAKRDLPASWVLDGNCGTNTASYIERTNITTGFSDFKGQEKPVPLPVEMTQLMAKPLQTAIQLTFATRVEINNQGFELQRSEDNVNFSKIAWLPAQGPSEYRWNDETVSRGKSYFYRLKQLDIDGTYRFSNVVEAKLPETQSFRIYPNPAIDQVRISIEGLTTETVQIRLLNTLGQTVLEKDFSTRQGSFDEAIELKGLTSGTYQVLVITETMRYSDKIVIR